MSKRKLMRFHTQFDPNYKGSQGKEMDSNSMTEPDMSLSVKELLLNHTRGLNSDSITRNGEYFEEEVPIFKDITEMYEARENLLNQQKELENLIKEEQNAKQATRDSETENTSGTMREDDKSQQKSPKGHSEGNGVDKTNKET